MSAEISDANDHLAGLAPASYQRRGPNSRDRSETSSKIGEVKIDIGYIRRDLDELREFAKEARNDLSAMKIESGRLSERVSHLPDKGFIVRAVTVALGITVAILTIIGALAKVFWH